MADLKEQLIQNIKNELLTKEYEASIVENITDIIAINLIDYDIQERTNNTSDYTNEELINSFINCLSIEGKSTGTINQYKRSLNKLFSFLNNKNYDAITSSDIRGWLASLKQVNNKNTSIRNQKNYITPFFGWLYNEQLIEKNPCISIRPIKTLEEEKVPFTSEEIDTIRTSCKDAKERAMVEFLLSSGLRVSEMCNVKLEDMDLDNLIVKVKNGKGGKDRIAFITPIAKKYILKYLNENKHSSEYLFTSTLNKQYTIGGIRYVTMSLSKRCDIHIHPHKFRRTLATNLARKGMPIQEIQKLLGHSNIEITKGYIETKTEMVQASYRQLAA